MNGKFIPFSRRKNSPSLTPFYFFILPSPSFPSAPLSFSFLSCLLIPLSPFPFPLPLLSTFSFFPLPHLQHTQTNVRKDEKRSHVHIFRNLYQYFISFWKAYPNNLSSEYLSLCLQLSDSLVLLNFMPGSCLLLKIRGWERYK